MLAREGERGPGHGHATAEEPLANHRHVAEALRPRKNNRQVALRRRVVVGMFLLERPVLSQPSVYM